MEMIYNDYDQNFMTLLRGFFCVTFEVQILRSTTRLRIARSRNPPKIACSLFLTMIGMTSSSIPLVTQQMKCHWICGVIGHHFYFRLARSTTTRTILALTTLLSTC